MNSAKLRKAAILIKYLDPPTAEGLLRQIPAAQATELRQAARQLTDVDPLEQREVLDEFLQHNPRPAQSANDGGVELAGSLAGDGDFDEPAHYAHSRAASTRTHGDANGPLFQFLHESEATELARLLEHEHPQTIALVLSHVGAERASEVLLCFAKPQQGEIVRRLMDLDEANPAALEAVKSSLEAKLKAHIEGRRRRASGLATVRQILKAAGPIAEHELRSNLAQHEDLAQLLGEKQHQPTVRQERKVVLSERRLFEELFTLTDSDLLNVLRRSDRQCLLLALAGSAVRLAERVLRLLPSRDAKALRRSLQNLGSLPLSDIERAQDELVWTAMEMESANQIHWPQALVGGLA